AGACPGRMGLLPGRANEGNQVRTADPSGRQARDRIEQGNDGQVPRRDEEVLLRSHEVQDLSGAVGDYVSDGEEVSLPGSGTLHSCRDPGSDSEHSVVVDSARIPDPG